MVYLYILYMTYVFFAVEADQEAAAYDEKQRVCFNFSTKEKGG